jgi:glycosyltransferase involved in cell wall biosynthesis
MGSKVLRIIHNIYSVGPGSFGLGPVALNLAREQNRLGHASDIWCVDNEEDCRWASLSSGLAANRIRRFKTIGPRKLCLSREMERAASGKAREISIVHQHALWTGLSRVTSLLRERHGIPTVISPHGSLEKWALIRSRWKKEVALIIFERNNLRNASCLHACSEQEIDGFRDSGLKNPIAVIPNGISSSWLDSSGDKDAFCCDFNIPSCKRIMLFLSRITPVKGLPMLMDALNKIRHHLDGWLIVIVGSDEFNHKAELEKKIKQFNLGEYVQFTGQLSGQEKRNAFSAASFFVLPTKREAAPVVVLEALGAGVPVLTTKGAPWKRLVTHNCGWWVDVDSESIAEALMDALQCSPNVLRQMGQRGKDLVASKCAWTSSARMTIELYEWLLGQSQRPDFVVVD